MPLYACGEGPPNSTARGPDLSRAPWLEGKSRREARRALKRFIVRAIWKLWQECIEDGAAKTCRVAA